MHKSSAQRGAGDCITLAYGVYISSVVSNAVGSLSGVYNHGERFGTAEPEVKLGISPAKTPRPQRSENNNKQFFQDKLSFLRNRSEERRVGKDYRTRCRR